VLKLHSLVSSGSGVPTPVKSHYMPSPCSTEREMVLRTSDGSTRVDPEILRPMCQT
jgi:hypothetical protein